MSLENDVDGKQAVESAEFQINKRDKNMVEMLMENFRGEAYQKDGIGGVYHSLYLFNVAITLGAINHDNFAAYEAVLSGKVPFYVQKGIILSREYYFDGNRGYRTKTRFFSRGAFNPLSVGGVKD